MKKYPECAFSFNDLYKAAFNENPSDEMLQNFSRLPQEEKNGVVKDWAQKAGWQTITRLGSDGITYTAFAPKF